MPYDIVDAYTEIKQLQSAYELLIQKLRDKNIIDPEEKDGK